MNSCTFQINFILFIFLSNTYLIFNLKAWHYHWPTHMEWPNRHAHAYEHTNTHTHTHTQSRSDTSESVSRHDPPILSILNLQSPMDLVAAAQLIFPVICTDASLLSNCSAHVTEILLCCSAFASLDQKSPVASSHFHSSISSISSAKELHNHWSKVRFALPAWLF